MAIPDSSTPSPGMSAHEDNGPVFVDASGRKLRLMRLIGGAALLLVAGYLVTIGIALTTGGPNAAAPFLPAAAVPSAPPKTSQIPDAARTGAATPSPTAEGPAPASVPLTVANYVTQASAPAGAAPAPAGASTRAASAPAAAPAPTATAIVGQGNPSAPGQDKRTIPTQPTHP